jgi:hypothetical protein
MLKFSIRKLTLWERYNGFYIIIIFHWSITQYRVETCCLNTLLNNTACTILVGAIPKTRLILLWDFEQKVSETLKKQLNLVKLFLPTFQCITITLGNISTKFNEKRNNLLWAICRLS